MAEGYHKASGEDGRREGEMCRLAIRRHTDRCFHRVEEETADGYIVEGILISREDVVEVVDLDRDGVPIPGCRRKLSP